jgi:carbon-monoxide dehydrogenase small subunit
MAELVPVSIVVNGELKEVEVDTRRTLADFLRHDLRLYGTHIGCEQGACGACTVHFDGKAIKSCLMLAVQADGHQVKTVEGLAANGPLHPVQQAFCDNHGLQCGFCTPGFLMVATALADTGQRPKGDALRKELAGNLCRCTGYVNIMKSVESFLENPAGRGHDER